MTESNKNAPPGRDADLSERGVGLIGFSIGIEVTAKDLKDC